MPAEPSVIAADTGRQAVCGTTAGEFVACDEPEGSHRAILAAAVVPALAVTQAVTRYVWPGNNPEMS